MHDQLLNHIRLFRTLCVACQAPLSMESSGQEFWSGLPFSPPGDLPELRLNRHLLHPPHWQQESFTNEPLGKSKLIAYTQLYYNIYLNFC